MNSHEQMDWKKELSSPPLSKHGFDDALRSKIEARINEVEQSQRSWFGKTLASISTAAVLCLLIIAVWSGNITDNDSTIADSAHMNQSEISITIEHEDSAAIHLESALLIGFRTDQKELVSASSKRTNRHSTYRTMLIAPNEQQIEVIAEGDGLLVPYKQQFWFINGRTAYSDHMTFHTLDIHPAGAESSFSSKATLAKELEINGAQEYQYIESVLYAGNELISVSEVEKSHNSKEASLDGQLRVRKLEQLAQLDRKPLANQDNSDSISLQQLFGEQADSAIKAALEQSAHSVHVISDGQHIKGEPLGNNWAIVRQNMRWVPMIGIPTPTQATDGDDLNMWSYELYELDSLPLTEDLISFDSICCTWDEIRSQVPNALDAYSSPNRDMIAIISEDELKIYPLVQEKIGASEMLSIPLEEGETPVMAQWATGQYVSIWKEKAGEYLQSE